MLESVECGLKLALNEQSDYSRLDVLATKDGSPFKASQYRHFKDERNSTCLKAGMPIRLTHKETDSKDRKSVV